MNTMNKLKQQKKERRIKDKYWSFNVKNKAGNQCERCKRKTHNNAHHLLPKELYPEHRHEEWNGICLCARCHRWGKLSAHQDGIGFVSFLLVRDRRQVEFLMEMIQSSYLKALKCLSAISEKEEEV